LLECRKSTIRGAAAHIVVGAPPTVSRLGGRLDADDSRENSQYDERNSHGDLLLEYCRKSYFQFDNPRVENASAGKRNTLGQSEL
jgi:hypothetical protein